MDSRRVSSDTLSLSLFSPLYPSLLTASVLFESVRRKHQQLVSLHLPSIHLPLSLFDDFKRFLECARAEVLLQLQRYTLPIGKM